MLRPYHPVLAGFRSEHPWKQGVLNSWSLQIRDRRLNHDRRIFIQVSLEWRYMRRICTAMPLPLCRTKGRGLPGFERTGKPPLRDRVEYYDIEVLSGDETIAFEMSIALQVLSRTVLELA